MRRSTDAVSPSPLHRAVLLRQGLSLELPRKQGIFRLEARDAAKGALLGSCQLWVAAARDGGTMFWSHDRCVMCFVPRCALCVRGPGTAQADNSVDAWVQSAAFPFMQQERQGRSSVHECAGLAKSVPQAGGQATCFAGGSVRLNGVLLKAGMTHKGITSA